MDILSKLLANIHSNKDLEYREILEQDRRDTHNHTAQDYQEVGSLVIAIHNKLVPVAVTHNNLAPVVATHNTTVEDLDPLSHHPRTADRIIKITMEIITTHKVHLLLIQITALAMEVWADMVGIIQDTALKHQDTLETMETMAKVVVV